MKQRDSILAIMREPFAAGLDEIYLQSCTIYGSWKEEPFIFAITAGLMSRLI